MIISDVKKHQLLLLCLLKFSFIFPAQQDAIPTISRIYGDSFTSEALQSPDYSDDDYQVYLAQIHQYPSDTSQGTVDYSFGQPRNYPGMQVPCNGFAGHFLQQKVKSMRELPTGNFLVGMDGKLDTSNNSNMMLTQITADGLIDTTFGTNGFLNLPRYQINEFLVAAVQDLSSNFYVAGYGEQGSIVRKYDKNGNELWVADNYIAGSFVTDIALEGTTRLLVAQQLSSQIGQLVAYDLQVGAIDTTFYNTSIVPGVIDSPDFGLAIGQLYGVVVSAQENIFIVYQNSSTGYIDLAALYSDGRSLISGFASETINPGVVYNLFSSTSSIDNVCLALDNYQNIIVAASTGTDIIMVRLDCQTGVHDQHFNSTGTLIIPSVGSDVVIQKIVGLSDGSMILAGYDQADGTMFMIKIKINGTLDTNFNAQGQLPGIIYFTINDQLSDCYARCLTGLSVQSSNGDLVAAGYQQRTAQDAIPMIMKLHGQVGTTEVVKDQQISMIPGIIDGSIIGQKEISSIPGWDCLYGYAAYAVQANNDGTIYIAFGNGKNFIIGLVDGNMYPVTSFGTNGLTAPESMLNIYSLVVDSQGQPIIAGRDIGTDLVGGSTHGQQKVLRYTRSGDIETEFLQILPLMVGTIVAEQKSGQIIVGGYMKGSGVICGYQNNGKAFVSSFGIPLLGGYYATGVNSSIDDFAVDDQDAIYIVYKNLSNHVCLEKIMPNGSCKVAAFNNGQAVNTGIVAINATNIAINSDNNILVGASTSKGVQVCLYDGKTGIALNSITTIPLSDEACILTNIIGSAQDFMGSCYDPDGDSHLFRIKGSSGELDKNFGSLQNGVTFFSLSLSVAFRNISVQLDGRILVVGVDGNLPVLLRLHGYSYVNQYPQMPGKATAGTLDTTLFYTPEIRADYRDDPGAIDTSYGVFNFDSLSSGDFDLAGFTMKHIYTYANGSFLFVADNGTDTIIFRLLNNASLDTLVNGGLGFNQTMTPGYIRLVGQANPTSLYIDEQGAIFVAGGTTTSWAQVYNHDGSSLSSWNNPADSLTQVCEVAVQSCGRRIIAGKGDLYGMLYGYTPTGQLDVGFGANGIVSTGVTSAIVDIAIDNQDRIIIVYVVDGAAVMQRVSSQGLSITSLNSGTAMTDIADNQLKVAFDQVGNIVVAAATSTGFSLRRYDSSGANNPSTLVTIPAGGSSTSHLGNLYVTSDNKVGLVGYETTGNNIVCARLNASFALDPAFNGGVALITTDTPMDRVYDATVYVDNRIMIVGGSSTVPNPYMARVFGDDYVTVKSQSPLQGIACTNDLTFGQSASNGITFHALTGGATQGQVAQAIALQDEQNIIVAFDGQSTANSDNRIFINKFRTEGLLQTDFGSGGKIEVQQTYANEYVRDMVTFTQAGVHKAIIAGYATNNSGSISNSLLFQYNLDSPGFDTSFGGFDGNPQGFTSGLGQQFYSVGQQSQGRIIAGGLDRFGNGLLVGYTSFGKLDKSFGSGGMVRQGSTGIYTQIIDPQDRVVIAYNDGDNRLAVGRFVASGSGLDTRFNTAGITPGIVSASDRISGISGNNNFQVAIDQNGKILVVAVNNSGLDFVVSRYTSDGVFDTSCTITSFMLGGTTSLVIAKLLIDAQGKIAIIGYDNATSDTILIVQLLADLSGLDLTANSTGTPGYLKYAISSGATQKVTDALIHPDGRILIVGSQV